jgi:hypothetical protein
MKGKRLSLTRKILRKNNLKALVIKVIVVVEEEVNRVRVEAIVHISVVEINHRNR